MNPLEIVGLAWAVGGGIVAPGMALVRRFDLGRGRLERLVLAVAIGRVLLGAVTLLLTSTLGAGALHVWPVLALAAWWVISRRSASRGAPEPESSWARWPLVLALLASLLVVHATVGRSGLEYGDAGLVFFGRDVTFDPLVHIAGTWHLIDLGLPLEITFAAGTEFTNSYLPFAVRGGVHVLSGVPLLDLTFRSLPLLELFALCATAAVLTRRLGGDALAASLAGLLVALGSGAEILLPLAGKLLGHAPAGVDTWSFFGPYLLGANSITPGLQTWFAALLLLLGMDPTRRAGAVVAGMLIAALFEIKLFLWAAALPVLILLAVAGLRAGVGAGGRALRLCAVAAVGFSIPSLVEKLYWAARLSETGNQGFGVCIGCLPRYLAAAAVRGELPRFSGFAEFNNAALLNPALLLDTLLSGAAVLAIALGARWVAVPQLWRGARLATTPDSENAGTVWVHRLAGGAALAGLGLAFVVSTAPHYLNTAEFTWIATFGLWPFVALVVARWCHARRFLAIACLALLGLASTARVLLELGYGAAPVLAVSLEERDLLEQFREISRPGEIVVEPSFLEDVEVPSPVTWISGRAVHLTNRSAAATLPEAEARARYARIIDVFAQDDRERALAALGETGATWVWAPARQPLPPATARALPIALESPAGRIHRVPAASDPAPTQGR